MKIVKINKKKFVRTSKLQASYLLTGVSFLTIVSIMTFLLIEASKSLSENIFLFHSFSDVLLVVLWSISGILPIIRLLRMKRRNQFKKIDTLLLVFLEALFVPSLIPLLRMRTETIDAESVNEMVVNTKIFFCVLTISLVLGIICTMVLTKNKKNNWWLYVVFSPYILSGWIIQRDYKAFQKLLSMEGFSDEKIAEMVIWIDGNLNLMNELWFKILGLMIVVLVLMMGVACVEIVWKKTENWRATKNWQEKQN